MFESVNVCERLKFTTGTWRFNTHLESFGSKCGVRVEWEGSECGVREESERGNKNGTKSLGKAKRLSSKQTNRQTRLNKHTDYFKSHTFNN